MKTKKIIAALLCFVLLFVAVVEATPNDAFAATKQELQEKINNIDKQIAENRKKIEELKNKKEAQQEYLTTLEAQITANKEKADAIDYQIRAIDKEIEKLNEQIRALRKEISAIRAEIKVANEQIAETQAQIDESKTQLSAKLRNSYMSGDQSNLKILMGSNSLASFLTHLELMKRMSENDKKMIDEFKQIVIKLKKQKAELLEKKKVLDEKKNKFLEAKDEKVGKKDELKAKRAEYTKTLNSLNKNYSDINTLLDQIDKSSAAYEGYIKRLQNERTAADREIERIISQSQQTTQGTTPPPYASDKTWVRPLGTAGYVSSGFGNRDPRIGGWAFHGGTDFAAGEGTPIYAARGGTVIAAIWGTTGYGRYVVLDHGDGYTTVYGHCSTLLVSQGQVVQKGQPIARVGSTGNSTGNHLHFEVRYNNVKQNPLGYVSA